MLNAPKWFEEEEKLIWELLEEKLPIKEMFKIYTKRFNRSEEALRKKIVRMIRQQESSTQNDVKVKPSLPPPSLDKAKDLCNKWKTKSEILSPITRSVTKKILSLSDLHVPFTRWDDLKNILEREKEVSTVVLNGDIFDGYAFSHYGKSKSVSPINEYLAVMELVRYLSANYEQVVLVSGNHDRRASKALSHSDLDKSVASVFRPDLLARVANGEILDESGRVVEKINFNNVHYPAQETWYVQIGGTIFVHPDAWYGGHPGQTVTKLCDYFTKRLGSNEFDSIVVGHTHRCFKGIYADKLCIEQGAMSCFMDYQHKSDLRFSHATNGYAVIYQDADGNTDYNRSNFVYFGSELPLRKEILR